MDEILREMVDHHQIRKLIAEYCHGCDRRHEAQMASVYAYDSWDDHGDKKMSGQDFSRWTVATQIEHDIGVSHLVGQSLISIDGDSAAAETYFLAVLRRPGDPVAIDQMGGRYVDELVREGSGWKIKNRIAVYDWSISHSVDEDRFGKIAFVRGTAYSQDVGTRALCNHGWQLASANTD